MPAPYPETLKEDLALWLAGGGTLLAWCRMRSISTATAYTWQKTAAFRRKVETHRRRAADRAIGTMARHFSKAVGEIDRLRQHGRDDGVKLAAARTLVDMVLNGRRHAARKAEVRRLIRSADAALRSPAPGGRRSPVSPAPAADEDEAGAPQAPRRTK